MNLDILGVVGFESPRMGLVKMDEDRHDLDFDTSAQVTYRQLRNI